MIAQANQQFFMIAVDLGEMAVDGRGEDHGKVCEIVRLVSAPSRHARALMMMAFYFRNGMCDFDPRRGAEISPPISPRHIALY